MAEAYTTALAARSIKKKEDEMKFLKIVLAILMLVAAGCAFFYFSPWPEIAYLKHKYKNMNYTLPKDYDADKANVIFIRDIAYGSEYPDGFLDIIKPKNATGKEKVIIWAHGGSYIGGDKKDVEHYMLLIANKGYVVANINYAVAPEHRYPVPLKQIEEAYVFLKANAREYGLDMDKAYFGGDSAGAQIAAQFVNIQTNPEYAQEVNEAAKTILLDEVAGKNNIAGAILFCGPYNLKTLVNPAEGTMSLPFKKIAWAYFNTKDIHNKNIALASITDKISEDYPPVFITDGNVFTFEGHALEFEAALKNKNVPVTSVFYGKDEANLKHEYQFYMDSDYAWNTFDKLIAFLKETSK